MMCLETTSAFSCCIFKPCLVNCQMVEAVESKRNEVNAGLYRHWKPIVPVI